MLGNIEMPLQAGAAQLPCPQPPLLPATAGGEEATQHPGRQSPLHWSPNLPCPRAGAWPRLTPAQDSSWDLPQQPQAWHSLLPTGSDVPAHAIMNMDAFCSKFLLHCHNGFSLRSDLSLLS